MGARKKDDDDVLPHFQPVLVLCLNIVFQPSCQTSSMQEEEIDPANRYRFPVGCQMLSLVGHKDLKEQDPSGLLLSYS